MVRKIIKIDESKCDACGLCVSACHEGAIGIVDGKASQLPCLFYSRAFRYETPVSYF